MDCAEPAQEGTYFVRYYTVPAALRQNDAMETGHFDANEINQRFLKLFPGNACIAIICGKNIKSCIILSICVWKKLKNFWMHPT